MKKATVLFAIVLIVAVGKAETPTDDTSEFFFTRLAYSENGYRGLVRDTLPPSLEAVNHTPCLSRVL